MNSARPPRQLPAWNPGRMFFDSGNEDAVPQYHFGMTPSQGYNSGNLIASAEYQNSPRSHPIERWRVPEGSNKRRRTESVEGCQPCCNREARENDAMSSISSECCSSCSEGVPCAEPDCKIQREIVIPCAKDSCASSVCPDEACFTVGMSNRQQDGIVPSSDRMNNWTSTPWNPQEPRTSKNRLSPRDSGVSIDPNLAQVLESLPASSVSGSVGRRATSPTTPPVVDNSDLSYYPQFTGNTSQATCQNGSTPILSGAGTLFNQHSYVSSEPFLPGTGSINCGWDQCAQLFFTQEDFTSHLHHDHVDPQMTFDCPVQLAACPQHISSNPLAHLEAAHGLNVNDNSYQCPAANCPPETFCNPADLHKHLDLAHATPATGSLQCGWNSCGTVFTDQLQLLDHLPNHFQTPPVSHTNENEDTIKLAETPQYPATVTESVLPSDKHTCRWKVGDGICGVHLLSENELQDHIKSQHLKLLDVRSGYFCQWDNCDRNLTSAAKGKTAGFNQRQKLERHMHTHTLYKSSACHICHKTFSAKQALNQHMHIHTGEKPWKCDYANCGKAFAQQSALTMHLRTHTKEKPLKCEICGKGFSESSNLTKHRKIHGIVGNHPCAILGCERTFYRADQLKKHLQKHYGNPSGACDSSPGPSSAASTPAPSVAGEDGYW